jgi:amino acid transporter
VIGTLAPDFEYLLRLSPRGCFGHTLVGSFILTLPLAVLVLWIFHAFVKRPTATLLPEAIQCRLQDHLDGFRFGGAARFVRIVVSILLGIATLLLWDSFTHSTTWPYRHWSVLRQSFALPIVGPIPLYKILQHGSTIAGIGILSTWLVHWYGTAQPTLQLRKSLSSRRRAVVIAVVTTVALVGAVARALREPECQADTSPSTNSLLRRRSRPWLSYGGSL